MKWNPGNIALLAEEFSESYHPDGIEDIPYIGLEHVEAQSLKLLNIGSSLDVQSGKQKFKEGDILFGTMRPYFRKVIKASFDGVCSTEFSVIRPKRVQDMAYVFYHIAQERFIEFATTNSKGDRPRTKWELFSKFPARIPPAEIRERIGSVLSAYDDLIENNLRRIKLLEESTRQLYKEWFVRLHFPGYEHTKLIEGVPEGWERKTLSEASESVNYGYTESAQTEEVGPKYLRITDIVPSFIDWSTVPYCPITERKKEKFSLREGDIVVARTGATVGYAKRLNKRHPEAVFASYLVRFRLSPKVSSIFIGTFIESDDYKAYVKSRIGGAAQPNANAKVLGDVKILIPSHQLQKEFDEIVSKLIDQKEILQIQNQKLKQTRDLLLPKLMSGEVEV